MRKCDLQIFEIDSRSSADSATTAMAYFQRLAWAVVFLLGAFNFGYAQQRTLPAHPTLLSAEYKNERFPVVAADGQKPIIVYQGKRMSLPVNTVLSTDRVADYGGLEADLSAPKTLKKRYLFEKQSGAMYNATPPKVMEWEVSIEITARQDLAECYISTLLFSEELLMNDAEREKRRKHNRVVSSASQGSRPQLQLQQIPNLKAGESTTVTFTMTFNVNVSFTNLSLAIGVEEYKDNLVLQLYSQGQEVRTPQPEITATYYYHREKQIHTALVKNWLSKNSKGNQPLKPVQQIPPLFTSSEGFPAEASATLTIAADGTIDEVKLGGGTFPPDSEKILVDTLHAWLFLPRIENGVPVAAKAKIPLKF